MDSIESEIARIKAGLMKELRISPDSALDAIHEAYVRIDGRKYDPKAKLHYWYVTSRNVAIDNLKKLNKFKMGVEEIAEEPEPDRTEIENKALALVKEMLIVGGDHCTAMTYRFIWKLSYTDIADRMGVSETYARQLIFRGRKKIKKAIQ